MTNFWVCMIEPLKFIQEFLVEYKWSTAYCRSTNSKKSRLSKNITVYTSEDSILDCMLVEAFDFQKKRDSF